MAKKNALGRGLGALIEEAPRAHQPAQNSSVQEIALDQIDVNPYQPRTTFDEEALNELAESIKELGIIQPITVRKTENNRFQIISGERRTRASRLAGLTTIAAYVREADDQGMLEMALVENIQRQDLDAIEIAISYQRLMDECKLTQEVLSERVGKKRQTIGNYLRLLRLPVEIQKGIRMGVISMGHARTLITITDEELQLKIFEEAITNDLSVRRMEELVKELQNTESTTTLAKNDDGSDLTEEYEKLQEFLTGQFQSPIELKRNNKGKGKIIIHFRNNTELERILGLFENLNS
ncbi:MAG: ParB/RepB/Spo0J family partition protein [Salinivirgaceae bacterium]|nr:ParB/RepB/Spo0J family partition protein [Salinivirgaceae bacterium]MDD4746143.1 ParB/RepB/Spo0J family partition protein [Salinivirgaceae bacterium]MDY0279919.1 ParB/RepB/Spo0J family partition protein [Salinivirgaceae bacterium]